MIRPACMTDGEYRLWSEVNDAMTDPVSSPCMDCPVAFARAMRAEGCCDGEPGRRGGGRTVRRVGRGSKYATDELRIAARRQQWRGSKAARRAATMMSETGRQGVGSSLRPGPSHS